MAPKKRSANDETVPIRRSSRLANSTITTTTTKPEQPKTKKPKKSPKESKPIQKEAPISVVDESGKTIIIEHCLQCRQFKNRAILVKNGLEKDVEGVNVVVNPEKPRRGCFEIREENGEIFVSLLDMKRPFPPLKKLDMDQVIADIVEKIN